MKGITVTSKTVETTIHELEENIMGTVYYLNPDTDLVRDLIEGLLINEERYGYRACPCRLVYGTPEENSDIICPCDYRDDDISDFNACYCGLYVSETVYSGNERVSSIPERRLPYHKRIQQRQKKVNTTSGTENSLISQQLTSLSYPVWRCRVCGYLAARDTSPGICPICKVKDRFERFL